MGAELLSFLAVSLLVIATPGQDTALTTRNTLLGGRSGGIFTAVGVSAGQATWTLATSLGIGALLVASEPAFVALNLAGSAYLILLGAQALYGALRGGGQESATDLDLTAPRLPAASAFRQGLLSNLGNPKMLAFFTSLLPQFASTFAGLLALGLLFSCMTLAWLTAYTVAVAKAGAFLRKPRVRRSVEALTGTVLVALGLRLATEQR